MSKKKKTKKRKNNGVEVWTEEQYGEYLAGLYGMEYISGFTEGGVPYGIFKEDMEEYDGDELDEINDLDDKITF